jgi:actin-related protein 2
MENEESNAVIVLDNGSGYLKAGYSNQTSPELCIPALVGREILRYGEKIDLNKIKETKKKSEQKKLIKQMIKERHLKEIMIGDEIIGFRSLLDLSHPVTEGIITDEEDLFKLWDYTLTQKMGIEDPSERRIIVTEAPLNPLSNKIKIFLYLFSSFLLLKLYYFSLFQDILLIFP